MSAERIIRLHRDAAEKPPLGAACNGCGACCAAGPCPLSRWLLGHCDGACPALTWDEAGRRYRCGMAQQPASYLGWLPKVCEPLAIRLNLRWIASGIGCDFDAEIENA